MVFKTGSLFHRDRRRYSGIESALLALVVCLGMFDFVTPCPFTSSVSVAFTEIDKRQAQ